MTGFSYREGGADLDGFDCSGFVWYLYHCFGKEIPRNAKSQYKKLKNFRVPLGRAKPADILVFKVDRDWHSALFIGGDSFIHAPRRGRSVETERLSSYWRERLRGVFSPLPAK